MKVFAAVKENSVEILLVDVYVVILKTKADFSQKNVGEESHVLLRGFIC
jgi:hypothetical protein